jgi:prepilin-type N-terminal cleavage/methylation domain-containing protein
MKRQGFTLVELLVVIAIIALLMGILMPALARVRQIAFRMVCGTNLSGIGKAMLIYANDYDDELPRAGGPTSTWAVRIPNWLAGDRYDAYGVSRTDNSGGTASITSCFYLLVKYAEVTPKSFLCKGDSGVSEFKPANYQQGQRDLITLWDFGENPWNHCSYSYHMPFGLYALTTSSEPGMAVAADRNPWQPSPSAAAKTMAGPPPFDPDGGKEAVQVGNAIQHQEDAQNVLFLDISVRQEKASFCGINDDNIYTYWDGGDVRRGTPPTIGDAPMDRLDSLLVTDGDGTGGSDPGPNKPNPRLCFPAETLVWVDGALVQISKVVPGQKVQKPLSFRTLTSLSEKVCSREIFDVTEHDESEGPWQCHDVLLETGNCIRVADTHFFLLDSGQWVPVQDLTSGSKLVSLEGPVIVKHVVKRALTCVGKVYNLKVMNSEQYLVGKDGIVVRDW